MVLYNTAAFYLAREHIKIISLFLVLHEKISFEKVEQCKAIIGGCGFVRVLKLLED
jgi:hypothetical protein